MSVTHLSVVSADMWRRGYETRNSLASCQRIIIRPTTAQPLISLHNRRVSFCLLIISGSLSLRLPHTRAWYLRPGNDGVLVPIVLFPKPTPK